MDYSREKNIVEAITTDKWIDKWALESATYLVNAHGKGIAGSDEISHWLTCSLEEMMIQIRSDIEDMRCAFAPSDDADKHEKDCYHDLLLRRWWTYKVLEEVRNLQGNTLKYAVLVPGMIAAYNSKENRFDSKDGDEEC